jgi:hypothetical protein
MLLALRLASGGFVLDLQILAQILSDLIYLVAMVVIHLKRSETDQFLYECRTTDSNDKVIRELVSCRARRALSCPHKRSLFSSILTLFLLAVRYSQFEGQDLSCGVRSCRAR